VDRITLFLFGGVAHLEREPREPATEVKIAAVGPLTSLAIGGFFWVVQEWADDVNAAPLAVAVLRYLAIVNVALAVFNLLPGFPLDGGRLLRGVLWWRWNDFRRATARAAAWGSGIGFGIMALGVLEIFGGALVGGLWLVFIGMFLRGAATASARALAVDQALGRAAVGDLMVRDPIVVPADMTVSEAVEERFLRHGYGGFPVVRDGHVEGLVSLRQVKDCPPEQRPLRRVRDIMRPADPAVTIPVSAPVADGLRRMGAAGTGRLLVVDGDRVVGLITRTGITRYVELEAGLDDVAA
jgi:CBS domain-containing protein